MSAVERLAAAMSKAWDQHFPDEAPYTFETNGAVVDILAADATLAQDIEATDEGAAFTVVLVVHVPEGATLAALLTGVTLPALQVAW